MKKHQLETRREYEIARREIVKSRKTIIALGLWSVVIMFVYALYVISLF